MRTRGERGELSPLSSGKEPPDPREPSPKIPQNLAYAHRAVESGPSTPLGRWGLMQKYRQNSIST